MTGDEVKWYREGLRFQCSECGDCCTGAPGFVWVTPEEVTKLAGTQNMEEEEFRDKYTRRIGARISLVEFPNGDCVFFDPEKRNCRVYDVRPSQCQTWPFWESNLESPETWKQTCRECPGSGQGPVVALEQIEIQRRRVKI